MKPAQRLALWCNTAWFLVFLVLITELCVVQCERRKVNVQPRAQQSKEFLKVGTYGKGEFHANQSKIINERALSGAWKKEMSYLLKKKPFRVPVSDHFFPDWIKKRRKKKHKIKTSQYSQNKINLSAKNGKKRVKGKNKGKPLEIQYLESLKRAGKGEKERKGKKKGKHHKYPEFRYPDINNKRRGKPRRPRKTMENPKMRNNKKDKPKHKTPGKE